jgi:xanthine/CO dehydrogenase XdhC/CoxF family maturation factor
LPIGGHVALRAGKIAVSSIPRGSIVDQLALAAEHALSEAQPRCRTLQGPGFEALLEIIEPAPHLFVFGAGADAVPVVEFAHALGLGVTVCDTTARLSLRERFSSATEFHVGSVSSVLPRIEARRTPLAVVMSHDYRTDTEALELLLGSHAAYIGVLGPERRSARMLSDLSRSKPNLSPRDRARLRAPVGLDLGAETPVQIALSIVAEIQAVLGRANAVPLSQRGPVPIHTPDPTLTLPASASLARTGST